jgi:hypothetical protein
MFRNVTVPNRGFPHPIRLEDMEPPSKKVVVIRGWLYFDDSKQDEADGVPAFSVRCSRTDFGTIASNPSVRPAVIDKHLYVVIGSGKPLPITVPNDWVAPRHEKMCGVWWCVFEYMLHGKHTSRLFLMEGAGVAQEYEANPHWVLASGGGES